MLHLVKRVGINYGVLDDDDGVIDWVSKGDLERYVVGQGIAISGVAVDMSKLEPQVVSLTPEKSNFAGGENVFVNAKTFTINRSGNFTIRACKRNIKGVLSCDSEKAVMQFNCGVSVAVELADYEVFMFGKSADCVSLLNSLGRGETPQRPSYK